MAELFGLTFHAAGQIAEALISPHPAEKIFELVEEKIEEEGKELVKEVIAESPLGDAFEMAERIRKAIETHGLSEVRRASMFFFKRRAPSVFTGPLARVNAVLQKVLQDEIDRVTAEQKRLMEELRQTHGVHPVAGGNWAANRQEWLANGWKHDWRSQPRNPAGGPFHWSGEWVAGRLPYPVVTTKTGKPPPSRKTKRLRKIRRKARRYGRQLAKRLMSSWATWSG
jgi:hypothetical protein